MAAQTQYRHIEPEHMAQGFSPTAVTVGIIVLVALVALVGIRGGFKGFVPSMS